MTYKKYSSLVFQNVLKKKEFEVLELCESIRESMCCKLSSLILMNSMSWIVIKKFKPCAFDHFRLVIVKLFLWEKHTIRDYESGQIGR